MQSYKNYLMTLCSISTIQTRNQELCTAKAYHGQDKQNPATANHHYELLLSDASSLYRKFIQRMGVDTTWEPQDNIHDWLDQDSLLYNPEMAAAVFHYRAHISKDEWLCIYIQTEEMKEAAWKYSHKTQLILDRTFGVCDCRVFTFYCNGC